MTLALLALLAALGAALYFTRSADDQAPKPEQRLVFDFEPGSIIRLEVSGRERSVVVDRETGGPWWLQPEGEPADNARLTSLTQRLASLRASRRIAETGGSLESYGLSNPSLQMVIGLNDGQSRRLRVGARTPVETGYYALADDDPEVLVVPIAVVTALQGLVEQPPKVPPTATPRPTLPATPTRPPVSPPAASPPAKL